jgi:hypothetical protein
MNCKVTKEKLQATKKAQRLTDNDELVAASLAAMFMF